MTSAGIKVSGRYKLSIGDGLDVEESNHISYEGIRRLSGREMYPIGDEVADDVFGSPGESIPFITDGACFVINMPVGGMAEVLLSLEVYIGDQSRSPQQSDRLLSAGLGISLAGLSGELFFPDVPNDVVINTITLVSPIMDEELGDALDNRIVSTITLSSPLTVPQGRVLSISYFLDIDAPWHESDITPVVVTDTEANGTYEVSVSSGIHPFSDTSAGPGRGIDMGLGRDISGGLLLIDEISLPDRYDSYSWTYPEESRIVATATGHRIEFRIRWDTSNESRDDSLLLQLAVITRLGVFYITSLTTEFTVIHDYVLSMVFSFDIND